MKKLLLALLIIGLLPVAVYAQYPGTEVEAFEYDGTKWNSMGVGGAAVNARCFGSVPLDSACNKNWDVKVIIQADIAQWARWSLTGTRWDWFVRKPGNYAADCLTGVLWSNQNLLVDYHDFGNLIAYDTAKAIDDTIEVFYAVWPLGSPPPGKWDPAGPDWRSPTQLNDPAEWDTIPDSEALHGGIQFKLWNYIHVDSCNSACQYGDTAYVSLKLLCQKAWIDTLTGYFR